MRQNKVKEYKNIIFVLVFFLFGITSQANAIPQLQLGSANVPQGGTGTLNLSLSGGTETYAGVNAKILLPKGVTVTGISKGELLSSGNFTTNYKTDSTNNWATVVAYSGTGTFSTAGVLLALNIKADSTVTPATYPVSFAATNTNSLVNSRYAISNAGGTQSVALTTKAGAVTISPPNPSDVILTMDDVKASLGSTDIPLIISLNNTTKTVASIELRVRYDATAGIHAKSNYELTSRTQGFTGSVTVTENGVSSEAKILLYNMSGTSIAVGTGQIFKVLFNVDATAKLPTTLSFADCILSDASGSSISANYTDTATFLLSTGGDMNGDGKINILDLQKLINCILAKGSCDGGDLNGDGRYNILDLQKLINKIINPSARSSKNTESRLQSDGINTLILPSVNLKQNETGTFGLNLINEDAVSAAEIHFSYDASIGFNVTGVNLASRTVGFENPIFQVNNSDPKNVEVSVILYSMSGSSITQGDENILEFDYQTSDEGEGSTLLIFKDVIFSDQNGELVQSDLQNGKVLFDNGQITPGDINNDQIVDLLDVIQALKILTGISDGTNISLNADVNGDGKIGTEDVVYMLQVIADVK